MPGRSTGATTKGEERRASHATERIVSKEGICSGFSNMWPVERRRTKRTFLFDIVIFNWHN